MLTKKAYSWLTNKCSLFPVFRENRVFTIYLLMIIEEPYGAIFKGRLLPTRQTAACCWEISISQRLFLNQWIALQPSWHSLHQDQLQNKSNRNLDKSRIRLSSQLVIQSQFLDKSITEWRGEDRVERAFYDRVTHTHPEFLVARAEIGARV